MSLFFYSCFDNINVTRTPRAKGRRNIVNKMETVKGSKIRCEQKQQPPGTTAVTGGMTFSYCLVKLKIGGLKRYPQIFRKCVSQISSV